MTHLDTQLAEAIKVGATLPLIPDGLGLTEAYDLQHQVTALVSGQPGGIKVGVTAIKVQGMLGLSQPLIASLYQGAQLVSGAHLDEVEGRIIEAEVAMKISKEGLPLAIAPALEIVAVRFANPKQFTAANLVACNLGADLFVVGEFAPWNEAFEDLPIVLSVNGEAVNHTATNDSGSLKQSARWVAQEAEQRGYEFDEEMVFMMGAFGKTLAAEKGHYQGDYGELGKIELTIG